MYARLVPPLIIMFVFAAQIKMMVNCGLTKRIKKYVYCRKVTPLTHPNHNDAAVGTPPNRTERHQRSGIISASDLNLFTVDEHSESGPMSGCVVEKDSWESSHEESDFSSCEAKRAD